MKLIAALAALSLLLPAPAAQAAPKKASKPSPLYVCPMTGKLSRKSKVTLVSGGTELHFCTAGCRTAFRKLPADAQKKRVAAAQAKARKPANSGPRTVVSRCPITGEQVQGEGGGQIVWSRYEVHFCCAGCKDEFQKLTAAEREEKIKESLAAK